MNLDIRPARTIDYPDILALNLESEAMLSPLDEARLRSSTRKRPTTASFATNGRVVAFLLAFREGADYDSPNYLWFAQRYADFLYIDRVVVAATHQGRGLGARLYATCSLSRASTPSTR